MVHFYKSFSYHLPGFYTDKILDMLLPPKEDPFQGRAVKFNQPENKMSCAQREKFFCSGVGQKSSGVGCSGVEIPCSGVEIGG